MPTWESKPRAGELRIWWFGRESRAEFDEVSLLLRRRGWVRSWRQTADWEASASGLHPHLVIFSLSHPGELAQPAVERIRAASPLATLICLGGPWTEGHHRTGNPVQGVLHLSWQQFPAWFCQACEAWWVHRRPGWITGLSERRICEAASPVRSWKKQQGILVGLVAASARITGPYAALCEANDIPYQEIFPQSFPARIDGCSSFLWDGSAAGGSLPVPFLRLSQLACQRGIVAVLTAVRAADVTRLRSLGATAVIGKPFLTNDLLWLLWECEKGVACRS